MAPVDAPERPRQAVHEPVDRAAEARPGPRLGLRLLLADVLATLGAWGAVLVVPTLDGTGPLSPVVATATTLGITLVTLLLVRRNRLHQARVAAIPAEELRRLARVAVSAVVLTLLLGAYGPAVPVAAALAGGALSFLAHLVARTGYRHWVDGQRRRGLLRRRVVLVGCTDDAEAMLTTLADQPELGWEVCGAVGDAARAEALGLAHLGGVTEAVRATRDAGAGGAIVMASSMDPGALNHVVRELSEAGLHVHISSGLQGISHQRLRTLAIGHEPLLYLEPRDLARWQHVVKRTMDVVLASVALVLSLPVLLLAMLAIRLDSPGPALFRQVRVGHRGEPFAILKLRTMTTDAEARLASLLDDNARKGPLFKATSDPRVTRIGAILRATSLDELPQLWNVLTGSMSLVGPRPALPEEVDQFDAELRQRTLVQPGITGLWQVEARDNPSFGPYRRLDLHYVENWSVGLDLAILVMTVGAVVGRGLRAITPTRARRTSVGARAAVLD